VWFVLRALLLSKALLDLQQVFSWPQNLLAI
jgi:hypothetical protein